MHSKNDYPEENAIIDYNINSAKNPQNQDLHYGHILERVVRRDCMGISEIARKLNISRRTLYNWFETKKITIDIIRKVGYVIGHDFSAEFPYEFSHEKNSDDEELFKDSAFSTEKPNDAVYYWMDRYIRLLENFNTVLSGKKDLKNDAPN